MTAADVDAFESNRSRLVAIAYGMLGSYAEAEDVVQDAYLRWHRVDAEQIDEPAAYLTTVTTRLAIDRLRSARMTRETYIGPWLPEPVLDADPSDPGDVVARAEQLSLAFVTALERLNPVERAVLLLRDVFDLDYAEIAGIVDRSLVNCRQIAARARAHVGEPGSSNRPSPDREAALVDAFASAVVEGDVGALCRLLAEDVILWSDGGGKVRAARHPIVGAERVARFLVGLAKHNLGRGFTAEPTRANGAPAFLVRHEGAPYSVTVLDLDADGVIGIRNVLNPDKLRHLHRS